jgi:hypothetical protein
MMKTKCVFIVLASSFVCDLILEENEGYVRNKPAAGYASTNLGKARKTVLLPFACHLRLPGISHCGDPDRFCR